MRRGRGDCRHDAQRRTIDRRDVVRPEVADVGLAAQDVDSGGDGHGDAAGGRHRNRRHRAARHAIDDRHAVAVVVADIDVVRQGVDADDGRAVANGYRRNGSVERLEGDRRRRSLSPGPERVERVRREVERAPRRQPGRRCIRRRPLVEHGRGRVVRPCDRRALPVEDLRRVEVRIRMVGPADPGGIELRSRRSRRTRASAGCRRERLRPNDRR